MGVPECMSKHRLMVLVRIETEGPPTYCSRQRERDMAQARLMTPRNDDIVGAADFAQPASSLVEEALAQVRPRGRQLSQQSW
jgi:hypothetical protein